MAIDAKIDNRRCYACLYLVVMVMASQNEVDLGDLLCKPGIIGDPHVCEGNHNLRTYSVIIPNLSLLLCVSRTVNRHHINANDIK